MTQTVKAYLRRVLIWIDQGVNVLFGPLFNRIFQADIWGNEDETISSVVGKLAMEGKALRTEAIINWFFQLLTGETNHCRSNIEPNEGVPIPLSDQ